MIRTVLRAILGFALRLFFSRIEVCGLERLPSDRALLFVQNHPNALVDPLFLLCLAPRKVSFLAKAPLFRMPLVNIFVRALDSLPVYRAVDHNDPRKNRETFERAQAILRKGGAIAIFPEGTTHNDPHLRPLKTGAARIALGASSSGEGVALSIVPVGVYYTAKRVFRSKALITFGEAIEVPRLAQADPLPPDAVHDLSEQIRDGLMAVTVNADNDQALAWIARGQKIFSESAEVSESATVEQEFTMRRRFVEGYDWYRRVMPARLEELERGIAEYEKTAAAAGVQSDSVTRPDYPTRYMNRYIALNLAELAVLLGPGIIGTVVNWPLYRTIGVVSNQVIGSKDSTAVSTAKLGLSLLLYPLLWFAVALFAGYKGGTSIGAAAAVLCPLCAWCAVLFQERLERFRETLAPYVLWRRNRALFERLYQARAALRDEIARLGEEQERAAAVGDVAPSP